MSHFKGRQVDYYQYINSAEWRDRAKAAKKAVGYRCQVCNKHSSEVTLDAHHRTYDRLGHEASQDITVLCRDCHALYHGKSEKKEEGPPLWERLILIPFQLIPLAFLALIVAFLVQTYISSSNASFEPVQAPLAEASTAKPTPTPEPTVTPTPTETAVPFVMPTREEFIELCVPHGEPYDGYCLDGYSYVTQKDEDRADFIVWCMEDGDEWEYCDFQYDSILDDIAFEATEEARWAEIHAADEYLEDYEDYED